MAFETAKWIAPQSPVSVPVFKRSFELNKLPGVAKIDITGLGYFEAYVNGMPLTDARLLPAASDYLRRDFSDATYPVRDYFTHRIYYHTFNITDFFKARRKRVKNHMRRRLVRSKRENCRGQDGVFGQTSMYI